jgi:NAD+ kinase
VQVRQSLGHHINHNDRDCLHEITRALDGEGASIAWPILITRTHELDRGTAVKEGLCRWLHLSWSGTVGVSLERLTYWPRESIVPASRPVERVLVLGNATRPGVKDEVARLRPFLEQHVTVEVCDLEQKADLRCARGDIALVFGGDGAILRAARQMGYQQTPVLGINLGKLGFLADLTPAQMVDCFPDVVRGNYRIARHIMFECEIIDPPARHLAGDGKKAGRSRPGPKKKQARKLLGLNEVVLHTGPPYRMMEVDLLVDGETVSRFAGDGLIVSTPVGSTAHSLSAGGPILGQELAALVITPISPHTLTNRPVVDSADKTYTIDIRRAPGDAALVVDGQETIPVTTGQQVMLRKAPVAFQLVKVPGHSYYETLREKLHWGTPPAYRHEP